MTAKLYAVPPVRRSRVARELVLDAVEHAEGRPAKGHQRIVGYAIVSVSADGTTTRTVHHPNSNGMANTAFRAIVKQALNDAFVTRIVREEIIDAFKGED